MEPGGKRKCAASSGFADPPLRTLKPVAEPMADSILIAADEDVVACDLGGDAALLDLRSSTYYTLNPVGAFVWNRIGTPISFGALCDAVTAEFDVESARCRADIAVLLEQLREAGLVRAA